MNVMPRIARAALALAAMSVAAFAAQAQTIRYQPSVPYGLTPSSINTTTQIRVEYFNSNGNLLHTTLCGPAGCGPGFSGAARVVASLEYNPNREEVVTEVCNGVRSTVPQGFCVDGLLVVTLRLRTGVLVVKHVAEGGRPLLELTSGSGPRFEFFENSTRFWPAPDILNRVGNGLAFPAGVYKVTASDLPGRCLPVVVNNGQTLTVGTSGETTVEILYRGTQCLIYVSVDRNVPGLSLLSDTGRFDCSALPGADTVCTGRLRFNEQTRLTALLPAGLEPYFEWVNNTCERLPLDRTTCTFKPTSDIPLRLSVRPAGAAPPPADPVGLAVAAGGSPLADGVVAKGAAAVSMLQLRATPLNGATSLQALTFKSSGSGRDDLDLTVKVVADLNSNGRADPGETVLAQGRPAADDGSLRLALATPLTVATALDLVVVVDVAADVHSASAAAWGGAGTVLALGLIAWPASRRRFGAAVAAAAIAIVLVSACGGGDDPATDPAVDVDVPPNPPPPPVQLTYRLDLTAVDAADAAAPGRALMVDALPINGVTLTVVQ